MLLVLQHPRVAFRDCGHCQEWEYDEETGKPLTDPRVGMIERRGLPPCRTPQGCPKGTPEDSCELTEQNWLAYQHYLECKAVGQFPGDSIVTRNAGIIRQVEDSTDRTRQESLQKIIIETMKLAARPRL